MSSVNNIVRAYAPPKKNKKSSYDVYIGNRSEWGNFYSRCYAFSYGKRKEMFSRCLDSNPNLCKRLEELKGKRLGCDCFDLKNCHGHELLDRLEKMPPQIKYAHLGRVYIFYNGINTPLSNMHFGKIQTQLGLKFISAYHMYGWKMACAMGEHFIQRHLERTQDPKKIHSLIRNLYRANRFPWSREESVWEMYQIIQIKWEQDEKFQKECMMLDRRLLPLKGGKNHMWCSGVDHNTIRRYQGGEYICPPSGITHINDARPRPRGLNTMGWLIAFITRLRSGDTFDDLNFSKFTPDLMEGYELVRKSLAVHNITLPNCRRYKKPITQFL